jgi:hypothetical protein
MDVHADAERWEWADPPNRLHGRQNLTDEAAYCPHCLDAGIVVLDQYGVNEQGEANMDLAVPCPVCEQGGMHAASWPGCEATPFWRQPAWAERLHTLSWGGLTGAHYRCNHPECKRVKAMRTRSVCLECSQREVKAAERARAEAGAA